MSADEVISLATITPIPDTTNADRVNERILSIRNAAINSADVKPEDTHWVWENFLQAERLSLLVGDGGMGKGMMTAWLFARLSTGDLPGVHQGNPTKSLFISTEEHYQSETKPRLIAQEADFKHITFIDDEKFHLILDEIGTEALAKYMHEDGIGIVHIDPIIDFFPDNKNSNKEEDVRSVLKPLNQAAQEYGISIVGLRHVAKSGNSLKNLIMGSTAWRNAARTVVGLLEHPEDESLRVALNLKMNNGTEEANGKCYKIVNTNVAELKKGVGRIEWTNESYSRSDLEQMTGQNAKEREKMSDKKSEEEQLVRDYFKTHGEVESKQAQKDLESILKASRAKVYRIIDRLGVIKGKQGDSSSTWSLPNTGSNQGPTDPNEGWLSQTF